MTHNAPNYGKLIKLLDRVIEEVGQRGNHTITFDMETTCARFEKYEEEHVAQLA